MTISLTVAHLLNQPTTRSSNVPHMHQPQNHQPRQRNKSCMQHSCFFLLLSVIQSRMTIRCLHSKKLSSLSHNKQKMGPQFSRPLTVVISLRCRHKQIQPTISTTTMPIDRYCATCGQLITLKRPLSLTEERKLTTAMLELSQLQALWECTPFEMCWTIFGTGHHFLSPVLPQWLAQVGEANICAE